MNSSSSSSETLQTTDNNSTISATPTKLKKQVYSRVNKKGVLITREYYYGAPNVKVEIPNKPTIKRKPYCKTRLIERIHLAPISDENLKKVFQLFDELHIGDGAADLDDRPAAVAADVN